MCFILTNNDLTNYVKTGDFEYINTNITYSNSRLMSGGYRKISNICFVAISVYVTTDTVIGSTLFTLPDALFQQELNCIGSNNAHTLIRILGNSVQTMEEVPEGRTLNISGIYISK